MGKRPDMSIIYTQSSLASSSVAHSNWRHYVGCMYTCDKSKQ